MDHSSPEKQLIISDEVITARRAAMNEAVGYVTELTMNGTFLQSQQKSSTNAEPQPNPNIYADFSQTSKKVEDFVMRARQNVENALNEGDPVDAAQS